MSVVIEALAAGVLALAIAAFAWFDVGLETSRSERTVRRTAPVAMTPFHKAEAATPTTAQAASSNC